MNITRNYPPTQSSGLAVSQTIPMAWGNVGKHCCHEVTRDGGQSTQSMDRATAAGHGPGAGLDREIVKIPKFQKKQGFLTLFVGCGQI